MKYLNLNGLIYLWNKINAKINTKQDTLVSGTNIKTVNNKSILGSGNITTPGVAVWGQITGDREEQEDLTDMVVFEDVEELIEMPDLGLITNNMNNVNPIKNIFIGTQAEYDALPDKTGILAIIEE